MGNYEDIAKEHANATAEMASVTKDQPVGILGTGLAAVAWALLECAEQVGDVRRAIDDAAKKSA